MTQQKSILHPSTAPPALLSEDFGKAMLQRSQVWWSAIVEGQLQIAKFMSDRLEKDGQTLKETLGCRNWADAFAVQRKWWDEVMVDYSTDTTKLTGLYANRMSSGALAERKHA